MIFTELSHYHMNLQFCYHAINEQEHLGVADKFLIKERYNQIIRSEALASKIDFEGNIPLMLDKKVRPTEEGFYDEGISEAGTLIGFDEAKEKIIKYF